jgi:large subunit ribosomal protein L29
MAKYKSKYLLTKTKDELNDRIQFLRKEQFNLRFQMVNGQIENPVRFRLIRREIAAIKTIINNNLMKVK